MGLGQEGQDRQLTAVTHLCFATCSFFTWFLLDFDEAAPDEGLHVMQSLSSSRAGPSFVQRDGPSRSESAIPPLLGLIIAEVIKDDLWPNPLKYFNTEADDEFEEEAQVENNNSRMELRMACPANGKENGLRASMSVRSLVMFTGKQGKGDVAQTVPGLLGALRLVDITMLDKYFPSVQMLTATGNLCTRVGSTYLP
eukprot:SM000001S04676  [mRNA]  locus=s1:1654274:1656081:+ [translate_table: standard]